MKKKLPKVVPLPISKKIDHNREIYYSKEDYKVSILEKNIEGTPLQMDHPSTKQIVKKIDEVFHSIHHSFHIPVLIKTKDKTYRTRLAGKFGNYLLTMDDEEIKITDILDFQILGQ